MTSHYEGTTRRLVPEVSVGGGAEAGWARIQPEAAPENRSQWRIPSPPLGWQNASPLQPQTRCHGSFLCGPDWAREEGSRQMSPLGVPGCASEEIRVCMAGLSNAGGGGMPSAGGPQSREVHPGASAPCWLGQPPAPPLVTGPLLLRLRTWAECQLWHSWFPARRPLTDALGAQLDTCHPLPPPLGEGRIELQRPWVRRADTQSKRIMGLQRQGLLCSVGTRPSQHRTWPTPHIGPVSLAAADEKQCTRCWGVTGQATHHIIHRGDPSAGVLGEALMPSPRVGPQNVPQIQWLLPLLPQPRTEPVA